MLQSLSERKTMAKTFSRNVSKSFLNSKWKQIIFLFICKLHSKVLLGKTRCVQILLNLCSCRSNELSVGVNPENGYRIAGNFRGRKLSRIGEKYNFRGENFRGLLAFTMPKDTTLPNFTEKTFANNHKTAKFCESFHPQKFPAIRYI